MKLFLLNVNIEIFGAFLSSNCSLKKLIKYRLLFEIYFDNRFVYYDKASFWL